MDFHCGALAQMGERIHGMDEVIGSIPIGSTTPNDIQFDEEKRFHRGDAVVLGASGSSLTL